MAKRSKAAAPVDAGAPLPERVITDVETLKALSDPLRIRILEAMVQAPDLSWTAKRIATALGVGQTKLYHHIKILEERELIRPTGQQLVRGIMETSYRIAALQLRLDRNLLTSGGPEVRSSAEQAITTVFDLARRDFEAALAAGLLGIDQAADPSHPFLLNRGLLRVSATRAVELRERLAALLAAFGSEADGDVTLGLFISLHPVPETDSKATRAARRPRRQPR